MKILAIYPANYSEKELASFKKAVDFLKKQGHNLKQDVEFRAKDYNKDEKKLNNFQKKLEKSIKDTDIVVADVTNPDIKVGYDISAALNEKKVVIALQKEKSAKTISSVHGNSTRTLLKKEYTDTNITDIVGEAIEEAKSKLDTKFILIISPEIDRYLDWASQTKRMHKAQIVRSAIEGVMKKDKQYKNYLQG